jgi:transposase
MDTDRGDTRQNGRRSAYHRIVNLMDDETLKMQVRHFLEVEHLSIRQISELLSISRKRIMRVMGTGPLPKKRPGIIEPYRRLIEEWYSRYPRLRAIQVLERLKTYGFTGGYTTVKDYTMNLRKKRKRQAYHELTFLPGEEVQIDWMERRLSFGTVYGFLFLLAYSRYLYGRFYPKHSFEFFLDGHIEAMREVGGIAKGHRYDNLKSVVLARKPDIILNPQFLDFSRHLGFSIHLCTPGRANEKGRVERVIQDIDNFFRAADFTSLDELNSKFMSWRHERNKKPHRVTGKAPFDLLAEERLNPLPAIDYKPCRLVPALISSTGFVACDTNRYSVPSSYSNMASTVILSPSSIEIVVDGKRVALHKRYFEKNLTIEHPSHRERLLNMTPHFKEERIYQLMKRMDKEIELFLHTAEKEGEDPRLSAIKLFRLLKNMARETLISAVREANSLGIYRITYVESLLSPGFKEQPVHPQKKELLEITYERRDLADYDELI